MSDTPRTELNESRNAERLVRMQLAAARDDAERLAGALEFARSCIQCREPWTTTCDSIINAALAAHEKGTP